MTDLEYYRKQVAQLDAVSPIVTMKLSDYVGNETKYITLNADSLKAITEYFNLRVQQTTVTRESIKDSVLTYLIGQNWTRDDAYEAGCCIADELQA